MNMTKTPAPRVRAVNLYTVEQDGQPVAQAMAISQAEAEPRAPVVTGSPDTIWLCYGDIDSDATHSECAEVMWCDDKQGPSDVCYVRADLFDAEHAQRVTLQRHAADQAQRIADMIRYSDEGIAQAQAALQERLTLDRANRGLVARIAELEAERDTLRARLAEIEPRPVPAIPDGWRLVPKKLTQEMRAEFVRAAREYMREYGGNSPEVMYEAAVAAAPEAAR
jgi:hypothetical protein